MSGLEKAKELGYVRETATDDPPGRTAEYPPDAAGEGVSHVDAATLAEFIRGKPFCHDAAVISPTAVGAVRTEVRNDDPMAFHNTAERGWRVGTVVPRERGDTIVFVPIDAEVEE
jgi:hypothetical protein